MAGSSIAFTQRRRGINPQTDELNQAYDLEVMGADGSGQEFVTINDLSRVDQPWGVFASWSPDGSQLAFTVVEPEPGSGGARAGCVVARCIEQRHRLGSLRSLPGAVARPRLHLVGLHRRSHPSFLSSRSGSIRLAPPGRCEYLPDREEP